MPLRSTLAQQVRRSAAAIEGGEALLAMIQAQRPALVDAADAGLPPVSALSAGLKAHFPALVTITPVRQFIGTAVKSVLEQEGYEVVQSGVRLLRDPVFSTGSLYRKRVPASKTASERVSEEIFSRLVEGLRPQERRTLVRILKRSLGEAGDE